VAGTRAVIILPFLLGAVAGLSTYVGGRLAMRWGQRRDLLFGLTGAMVIGLALLDLLPEALESGQSVHGAHIVFGATVAGAVLYILLRRLPAAGAAGRISLIRHSVIYGLGLGIAFQLSSATGWLVAIAVLAHDGRARPNEGIGGSWSMPPRRLSVSRPVRRYPSISDASRCR
jgi:zinc transporter ZupT